MDRGIGRRETIWLKIGHGSRLVFGLGRPISCLFVDRISTSDDLKIKNPSCRASQLANLFYSTMI